MVERSDPQPNRISNRLKSPIGSNLQPARIPNRFESPTESDPHDGARGSSSCFEWPTNLCPEGTHEFSPGRSPGILTGNARKCRRHGPREFGRAYGTQSRSRLKPRTSCGAEFVACLRHETNRRNNVPLGGAHIGNLLKRHSELPPRGDRPQAIFIRTSNRPIARLYLFMIGSLVGNYNRG